jgi:hypothetical protein
MVEFGRAQDAVDGRALELAHGRPHQAIRRFDPIILKQPDRPRGREVAPVLFEVLILRAATMSA